MLGWVALDQSEVRQVAKKLAVPGSVGTVDELGLGVIVDSISQFLFPAFTTLMTRARYFIFSRAVFDIAARSAWQRCNKSFREEELHFGNRRLFAEFKKIADRTFEDVDLCICLSLSRNKIVVSNSVKDDGQDYDGIAGSRNIRRKVGKGGLPSPPLFRILERYPAALYFSGLKVLKAFSQSVQDRDHLWELYLAHFLGEAETPIWDKEWAAVTENTGTYISKLYSEVRSAREKGASHGWEIVDQYGLTFQLTGREARLLEERLATAGDNKEHSAAIVATMLAASDVSQDEEGYARLAAICEKRDRQIAGAFRAASHAMAAMQPALTLYQNLRERLDPKKPRKEREEIAIQLVERLDFKSAKREMNALLKGWSPEGGWQKARLVMSWLNQWLDDGARASSPQSLLGVASKLIAKERQTVRTRGKDPCLSNNPIALTARGRRERDRKQPDDDSDPAEALVPRGRLSRALTIYSDIAKGLKKGGK